MFRVKINKSRLLTQVNQVDDAPRSNRQKIPTPCSMNVLQQTQAYLCLRFPNNISLNDRNG